MAYTLNLTYTGSGTKPLLWDYQSGINFLGGNLDQSIILKLSPWCTKFQISTAGIYNAQNATAGTAYIIYRPSSSSETTLASINYPSTPGTFGAITLVPTLTITNTTYLTNIDKIYIRRTSNIGNYWTSNSPPIYTFTYSIPETEIQGQYIKTETPGQQNSTTAGQLIAALDNSCRPSKNAILQPIQHAKFTTSKSTGFENLGSSNVLCTATALITCMNNISSHKLIDQMF